MSLHTSILLFIIFILSSSLSSLSSAAGQQPNGVSLNLWCVAKNNAEDSALQSAIDWACGTGGADCGPVQQGGACFDGSDIRKTASYVFNNYCGKNGMTEETCNFANTAALTDLDPSFSSCKFPSSMEGKSSNGTAAVGGGTSTADLTSSGNNVAYESMRVWCWCYAIVHLLWLNFV